MIRHMNNKWIFFNGSQKLEFPSFPLAFRALYNGVNPLPPREGEQPKTPLDAGKVYIVSPHGREYNYSKATEMAEIQDLLNERGWNKKAFREKTFNNKP